MFPSTTFICPICGQWATSAQHMMLHMQLSSTTIPSHHMSFNSMNDMFNGFRNQFPVDQSMISFSPNDFMTRSSMMIQPMRSTVQNVPALAGPLSSDTSLVQRTNITESSNTRVDNSNDHLATNVNINQDTLVKLVSEIVKAIKSENPTPQMNQQSSNTNTTTTTTVTSNQEKEKKAQTQSNNQIDQISDPHDRVQSSRNTQFRNRGNEKNNSNEYKPNFSNYNRVKRDTYQKSSDYKNSNVGYKRPRTNFFDKRKEEPFENEENRREWLSRNSNNNKRSMTDKINSVMNKRNNRNVNNDFRNNYKRGSNNNKNRVRNYSETKTECQWGDLSPQHNIPGSPSPWSSYIMEGWNDNSIDVNNSGNRNGLSWGTNTSLMTNGPDANNQFYQSDEETLPKSLNTTTTTSTRPSNTYSPPPSPYHSSSIRPTTMTTTTTTTTTTKTPTNIPSLLGSQPNDNPSSILPFVMIRQESNVFHSEKNHKNKEKESSDDDDDDPVHGIGLIDEEKQIQDKLDRIDSRELYEFKWIERSIDNPELIYFIQLQTKTIPSSNEDKYWEKHLKPLGVDPIIEKEHSIGDGSKLILFSITLKWRARWTLIFFQMHARTVKAVFIKESSTLSDEWSYSKKSPGSIKKEIWNQYIVNKPYSHQAPYSQRGKSRETWKENLRKWRSDVVPDGHLFADSVKAMFVEKQINSSFEGYMICQSAEHLLMTHPQVVFHNQRGQKYFMRLSENINSNSVSLFFLYPK